MKLLLADDHTLFRDALSQYIVRAEPESEITAVKNLYEALEAMERDSAQDLVLLDLRMPGMNGLEGFDTMREKYPDVPIALMSGIAETEDVQAVMDKGAAGYFPKTLSGKGVLQAIQLVLTGERFVPLDRKNNMIMPSYYADEDPKKADVSREDERPRMSELAESFKLSPREKEVLSYLVQGQSNKEIASALGLQVVTVKLHVRGVCRKLGAKNRTQAALKAQELSIIAPASTQAAS